LLLLTPFKGHLGSLVLGEKLAYILYPPLEKGYRMHKSSLLIYTKSYFFKSESACQARKRDDISNETGDIWLSHEKVK
jgi:hypothetical protein